MATFVLVHGASHGSWCWDKVVPILEARGNEVIAVDLPGNTYGEFDIPPGQVTLDTYAMHVCQVLDQLESEVILIGHSLGGLTISQAAEYRPDKIRVLVYLTAALLGPGEALKPVANRDPETVRSGLQSDTWVVSDDLSTVTYPEDRLKERFYSDCSDDDIAWAKTMLVPQPTGPLMDPMNTTGDNFGRIPKIYIECLQDGALGISSQREMHSKVPTTRTMTMDTGHSPFLSAPRELARHLNSI